MQAKPAICFVAPPSPSSRCRRLRNQFDTSDPHPCIPTLWSGRAPSKHKKDTMKFYALILGTTIVSALPNFAFAKENTNHVQIHCVYIVSDASVTRTGNHGVGHKLYCLPLGHIGFCKEKGLNGFMVDSRLGPEECILRQQPKSDTTRSPSPYPKPKPAPRHKPFPHQPRPDPGHLPAPDPMPTPKPVPPPAPQPVPEPLKY